MPMVGMPDCSMVPPTITRDTFGLPKMSGLSLELVTCTARLSFRPCSIRSRRMFSRTVAVILSITVASCAARFRFHLPRNVPNGDSSRTPGPPQIPVLTRAPSKSRKIVCTRDAGSISEPGR